jgi:hypothetical protein
MTKSAEDILLEVAQLQARLDEAVAMYQHVATTNEKTLASLLHKGSQDRTNGHIGLAGNIGRTRRIHVAVQPAAIEGMPAACMVLAHPGEDRREEPSRQTARHRQRIVTKDPHHALS